MSFEAILVNLRSKQVKMYISELHIVYMRFEKIEKHVFLLCPPSVYIADLDETHY